MNYLPAILAGCLCAAPVAAVEQVGNVYLLSDEEIEKCRDEGGCAFITAKQLGEAMVQVHDNALRSECLSNTRKLQ